VYAVGGVAELGREGGALGVGAELPQADGPVPRSVHGVKDLRRGLSEEETGRESQREREKEKSEKEIK
jgi:hypothetical protein